MPGAPAKMVCRRRSVTMTELGDVGDSLHVVFGATGAIGRTVVAELLHAGRDVRAVSRGGQAPGGAQGMAADAADPGQAVRAAAGAAVIYHCASPPYTQWPELFLH
jgi:nucleoside-diphosphate-sugar epimerase